MKNMVLVADNNKTRVMYLGIILKRMGYHCLTASNGEEAVSLVEIHRPQFIMVSTGLPRLEDLSVFRGRREEPDAYTPPIILMEGSPDELTEQRRLMLGACVLLTMPIIPDRLHQAIQECMYKPLGSKRKHLRAHVSVDVAVIVSGSERTMTTHTLSAGGVFIICDAPPAVGDTVEVLISLDNGLSIPAGGRVVHTREKGSGKTGEDFPPGFALEFLDISEPDRKALDVFVGSVVSDGIAENRGSRIYNAMKAYAHSDGAGI